jgi:hypothetical protein
MRVPFGSRGRCRARGAGWLLGGLAFGAAACEAVLELHRRCRHTTTRPRSVEPGSVLVVQDGRHAPGRRTGHRRKRLHTPTRSPLSRPTGAAFGVLDAGRQITYPEHQTRLTQGHTSNDDTHTIIPKNINKYRAFSRIDVSPSAYCPVHGCYGFGVRNSARRPCPGSA